MAEGGEADVGTGATLADFAGWIVTPAAPGAEHRH